MKKYTPYLIGGLVLVLLAGLAYWLTRQPAPAVAAEEPTLMPYIPPEYLEPEIPRAAPSTGRTIVGPRNPVSDPLNPTFLPQYPI